jgi:hypothetical protein
MKGTLTILSQIYLTTPVIRDTMSYQNFAVIGAGNLTSYAQSGLISSVLFLLNSPRSLERITLFRHGFKFGSNPSSYHRLELQSAIPVSAAKNEYLVIYQYINPNSETELTVIDQGETSEDLFTITQNTSKINGEELPVVAEKMQL